MLAEQIDTESVFKVPLTTIKEIKSHPNADRLEVCTVYGFEIVTSKNRYKVGDQVIFVPVDSILSERLEKILFPPESKIKLNKHRVRQIRIRQFPSQGLLIHPNEIESIVNTKFLKLEQDLKEILGVQKYEPPEQGPSVTLGKGLKGHKKLAHPDFHQYNGLPNVKWMPDLFQEGEMVVIQEKIHGTNARAAKLPYRANTLFKRIKVWLGIAQEFESLYGSNRVDISNASTYKGYYGEDIYGATFSKIDVFKKLPKNFTVFGEIIGPGIQKGYEYGLKEHKFVVFDMKTLNGDGTQSWLDPKTCKAMSESLGFDFVPVLYEGPYNKALVESLISGPSVFDPNEKVREGIVIKSMNEYSIEGNKKAVKAINPDYLDNSSNTDFH